MATAPAILITPQSVFELDPLLTTLYGPLDLDRQMIRVLDVEPGTHWRRHGGVHHEAYLHFR